MKNSLRIMVCVTQQKSCRRLIEAGQSMRRSERDELHVVHVFKEDWRYFGQLKESDALEYLFETASEFGADLSVLKAKDIEETLRDYMKKNRINVVVMGESKESSKQQNMIHRLQKHSVHPVEWTVVPAEPDVSDN